MAGLSEHETRASAPIGSDRREAEGDTDVFFVSLQFKGMTYEVPVQLEDMAATIFDFVHEVLDFPQANCKLIFKGKTLRLEDAEKTAIGDFRLGPGSKLMLLASSAEDVAFVKNIRADPLVKGFAEEERDERNRRKRARAAQTSAWGTKQDPEYRFGSIKAEFKYSTPPPYEAEKLLERLATDPGIIEIMKTRHFKVGVLTEMSPTEAQERMAKRGTPNMDLLGYNMNNGDMIVLRLRTDTLKGFRPYHDLINTLIHEMTHNVWSAHDQNFWKLFGELKAQYMRFHRFWSHGGQSAEGGQGQFSGFTSGVDENGEDVSGGGFGQVLGGTSAEFLSAPSSEAERRERALLAAEARKVTTEPVRNFLTGNGTWVSMCPCGQVHDPGYCPSTTSAALPSGEDGDKAEEASEVRVDAVIPAGVVSSVDAAEAAAAASAEEAPAEIPEVLPASEPARAAVEAPAEILDVPPAPEPARAAAEVAPAPEAAPAARPITTVAGEPALDVADLEALGLDGASLWIQRFSARLEAFRRMRSATDGDKRRIMALELLLRLVRNVVGSPQEPKFRRIRADNPRVRADLLAPGVSEEAEALMALLGFETTAEAGQRVFVLRDATFDHVRLRMGQELLENELQSGQVIVEP